MDVLEQIERLSARVRELEDREAIRNAIASYGPAVDSGDSLAAATLWTSDGVYDVGGMGASVGREAIQGLFDAELHQGLIRNGAAHILSPVHIVIHENEAMAVGYSCVFTRGDGGFRAERVAANRWALKREKQGWSVIERVNRLLDGSEEARALLAR